MNQIKQPEKANNIPTLALFLCFPWFSVQRRELEATSSLLMFQLSLKLPDQMIFTVTCSNWNTPKSIRLNYPGGTSAVNNAEILQVFQVRKQEHHVSATLFFGSHYQQERLIIECTATLIHPYHSHDLCNHFSIGSFTASLGPLIGYEGKLSLSAEGKWLTGLSNDFSIILYELVCCVFFFLIIWSWILKKDGSNSTKAVTILLLSCKINGVAFFSHEATTIIRLIYVNLILFSLCGTLFYKSLDSHLPFAKDYMKIWRLNSKTPVSPIFYSWIHVVRTCTTQIALVMMLPEVQWIQLYNCIYCNFGFLQHHRWAHGHLLLCKFPG